MSGASSVSSDPDRYLEPVTIKIYDLDFTVLVTVDDFLMDREYPDIEALKEFMVVRTNMEPSIRLYTCGKHFLFSFSVRQRLLASASVYYVKKCVLFIGSKIKIQENEVVSNFDLGEWVTEIENQFNGPLVIPFLVLCTLSD
jgi:hypothetical protein